MRVVLAMGLGLVALSEVWSQTGTFLDRHLASDLRVVSYNVYWDTIFPDLNATQAAKFQRVITALDPDVLHLQEVRRTADDVRTLLNNIAPLPDGNSWHAHKGGSNVTVSKYPLSMQRTNTIPTGDRSQAIALVELPDDLYPSDFYFMNNHYKCCGNPGGWEDALRQKQSDAIASWLGDALTLGGHVELPPGTPFAVVGDLNIVGSLGPLDTLITGNISDTGTYGFGGPPDWDGTSLADAHPRHNVSGTEDYTWRNDNSIFDPGRLDFVIYSDSALDVANSFILNTVSMSPAERSATGLEEFDITLDNSAQVYDHLPVVVDFRIFAFSESDYNFSRSVGVEDLAIWEAGFGIGAGAARRDGDGDGDGKVDGHDFLLWQRQFADTAPPTHAIPEPSSGLLALGILVTTLVRLRWRSTDGLVL